MWFYHAIYGSIRYVSKLNYRGYQFTKVIKVMSVIYILIPVALVFTAIAIYLFFWAVKTEQFDDLEKQGMSILFDEDEQQNNTRENNQTSSNEELEKKK